MRAVGAFLVVLGAAVGAIGLLWVALALFGREWDYCPSGDCYPGELMGLSLLAVGAAVGWAGLTAVRLREP